MSKIIEIINKYGEKTVIKNENAKFEQQRTRLSQFSHDLSLKMRILLGEMESDLKVLKLQNFDYDAWKGFVTLWNRIVHISKELNMEKPYLMAKKLVSFVKNKQTVNIIENLEFLIEHHLKKNKVEFLPNKHLKPLQIKSLKLLKELSNNIQIYIEKNPLLPVPLEERITEQPLLNIKQEIIPDIGTEEETKVPLVKKRN